MKREKKTPDRLPDAELAVMQAVWAACENSAAAPSRQIAGRLAPDRPMAATTLLTVLARLAEKGFVRIEKTGRAALYSPLVSQKTYRARQGRRLLDVVCGGSLPAFAAALCDADGGLTKEELARLRQLLERDEL